MAAKGEIGWRRHTEDGVKLKICAEPNGDKWRFYSQVKRNEKWEAIAEPPLEDWLNLLEGIRNRIARRLMTPESETRLIADIRKRFPNVELPK